MKNLTRSQLDQVTEMQNRLQDVLEKITKMRRIKNYEVTSKEWLIIAFLKSKSSINELFNNNLDNNRSDIKRIINRLRDILPRRLRKAVKKIFMN